MGENMNVFIYRNKSKDENDAVTKSLILALERYSVDYKIISAEDLAGEGCADAIFVLGGDGTLLLLNEFANKNGIPLIGINIGKLGFLSEFESYEIETAVKHFVDGELKCDQRIALEVNVLGKTFTAINDVYVQRLFSESLDSILPSVLVKADGNKLISSKGDGMVISTPTGSTAYSLSAGGAILTPGVNAFIITPISAHSLSQRPVVYSSDGIFEICISGEVGVGVFVDGKCVAKLSNGEKFTIKKAQKQTIFLRKKDFNFFKRLHMKLSGETGA